MLQNLYLHDLLYMCEMGCFLNSFHIYCSNYWYILQCTMYSICMVNMVSLDLPCWMDEFM